MSDFWSVLKWGSVVAGGLGIGAPLAYRAARQVYDDVYERIRRWRHDRLTVAHLETQNRLRDVREIRPDERGRFPLLYGQNGVLRDPNTLRSFTIQTVRETWPELEKLDAVIRTLQAAGGWPPSGVELPEIETQETELPTRIPLTGLLDGPPSFRHLVLGVTVDEKGQRTVVSSDMARLVHVAVGGSSGWGKSVFLRSLAYQLAKSADTIELAMIDLEGSTLAPFSECERLLWPVADREQDAAVILRELTEELTRRKSLFANHPGIDSLYAYNALVEEPLSPIACIIDEATALMADKEIEIGLRTLALRARKYGLWCVLAGQDWKATSLDTAIRNQLSTRVQFKAMSASQSRVLLQQSGAEELSVRGRALAWIPGREMVTIQAPIIGYTDILAAVMGGGPQQEMPREGMSKEAQIREFARQGMSMRQIELAVFGYAGGQAHVKVKNALKGTTTVADAQYDDTTGTVSERATVVVGRKEASQE